MAISDKGGGFRVWKFSRMRVAYTHCAGVGSLIECGGYVAGNDLPNRQKPQEKWQFDRAQRTEKALNTVSANLLHRKRSTARYGNPLFSSPAVDLYDKHGNLLISKPKNTPFSCLSISTLCRGAPGHSPTPRLSPTPAASTTAQTKHETPQHCAAVQRGCKAYKKRT